MERLTIFGIQLMAEKLDSSQCLQGNSDHAVNKSDSGGKTGRHRGDRLRKKLPIKTQQTGSASVVGKGGWGRKKVDYFCSY